MPSADGTPPATTTPLDARLASGRAAFNRADFFAAHELWEDVWRELAGDDRVLVQGLIQIAAGLHHLQRGRTVAAARVLARGAGKLAPWTTTAPPPARATANRRAPATSLPIAALARDVARLLEALAAPGGRAGGADASAIRF
jgi:hypothetical protein